MAAVDNGPLFLSQDAGRIWQARATTQRWSGAASSAHGSQFTAIANGSRLLTSETVPASRLAFTPAPGATGVPYTNFTFQVEDDGPVGSNLDPIPKTFSLDVSSDLPTPFALWAAQHGLPVDPTAHGGTHLLSFAFGLEADETPSPPIAVDGSSVLHRGQPDLAVLPASAGSGYAAVFGRRKSSALTYRVQLTADFTNWESVADSPWVLADDGIVEACYVPFPALLSKAVLLGFSAWRSLRGNQAHNDAASSACRMAPVRPRRMTSALTKAIRDNVLAEGRARVTNAIEHAAHLHRLTSELAEPVR